MSYHIYNTKDEAEQRSRNDWEVVLGRSKRPEDVTEFLYTIQEGKDGRTAVDIPDDLTELGLTEDTASNVTNAAPARGVVGDDTAPEIVEVLDEANWPKKVRPGT
jgi:hypothetical protein